MKEEILKISKELECDSISESEAKEQLLVLFGINNTFILVSDQVPPHDTEILAKSPTGTVHLAHWRPGYNIFTCQDKRDSTIGWSWKLI